MIPPWFSASVSAMPKKKEGRVQKPGLSLYRSEGTKESEQLGLLGWCEEVEIVGYALGFAAMALDGVVKGGGPAVVEQLRAGAHSPERRGAQFAPGFLTAGLDDAVAGAYVMEQEVTVRVNDFIAELVGNDKRARSYGCSGWGGNE
jgi:hypothetical protein